MRFGKNAALLMLISLAVVVCFAHGSETDVLEMKEGYSEIRVGARIEKIVPNDKDDVTEITISIPKSTGPIEEVIVTAKAPDKKPIKQVRPYKFIKDFDHDRYGLVIYLGKKNNIPFRLYLNAEQP